MASQRLHAGFGKALFEDLDNSDTRNSARSPGVYYAAQLQVDIRRVAKRPYTESGVPTLSRMITVS